MMKRAKLAESLRYKANMIRAGELIAVLQSADLMEQAATALESDALIETCQLIGIKDGKEVSLGNIAIPPQMKARELASDMFGRFTDDDGSEAEMCFWALQQYIEWSTKQNS